MSERIEALMRLKKAELVERLLIAEDKVAVFTLATAAKAVLDTPPPATEEAEPVAPAPTPTIADLLRSGDAHYYVDGTTLVVSVPRPSGRQLWEFVPKKFSNAAERKDAMEQLAAHIAAEKPLRKEQWRRR